MLCNPLTEIIGQRSSADDNESQALTKSKRVGGIEPDVTS